jgi:hypothetical protein
MRAYFQFWQKNRGKGASYYIMTSHLKCKKSKINSPLNLSMAFYQGRKISSMLHNTHPFQMLTCYHEKKKVNSWVNCQKILFLPVKDRSWNHFYTRTAMIKVQKINWISLKLLVSHRQLHKLIIVQISPQPLLPPNMSIW